MLLSRKCLNSQKSAAWQKLPIYSDFSLLCPIHLLLLPTFFLSLRKRKEFDDTKRIFSFQFIRRKHSQLPPIQNFFCGPQKTLRQTWKFSKISLPDLWSVQKRVLFYASFIMKAYILFTLLPQKKEENHYFWLHLLPTWWWYRIKIVLAISTQAVDKMLI